jgi:hypothetical protein
MSIPQGHRSPRYHAFLRRLQASGRSNMYGAIPYLMARFALDRETAFRVVCDWVDHQLPEAPRALRVAARSRSA